MPDRAPRTTPLGSLRYELVIPVSLPEGMTPEEFLADTSIEWQKGNGGRNPSSYRIGKDLDKVPRFGPRELRRA